MRPTRLIWILVLAAALLPMLAGAGGIQGQLRLKRPAQRDGAAAGVQPGTRDAVIYVDKVSDKVDRKLTPHRRWFGPKPHPPRIIHSGLSFVPRVLVAAAGSEVEFQNLDRVYHNAFSVSAAKRFDLGKYPPGHLASVRFERQGVVNLHCDIHPDEIGYLVLVPNHAFARPDSLGRFKLPKLPPGKYTVRVWHPRAGELRREVVVPPHGALTLELSY